VRHLALVCLLVAAMAALCWAGPDSGAAGRTVALTFDDLPGVSTRPTLAALRSMNERLLAALASAGAPAIGFVNEGKLEVEGERVHRLALLASWLDAGHTLGNHTHGHLGLTRTPIEDYERDVLRGEQATRPLLRARGLELTYFRHPFTQTGPTAEVKQRFEGFLQRHGYRIAPFTVEHADYIYARLYDDALDRADAAQARRVREVYLEHLDVMFTWFERLAHETFGRDIAQIFLLHVNALNAEAMPAMLERLARRGYRTVTLDEALRDPAYATPDGFIGPNGRSWLHRWRAGRQLPPRLRDEPDPPGWVLEAWRKLNP
jgi:peptidoglycan/xylan/chitin deacetylase (PgdA/CDA1 family)